MHDDASKAALARHDRADMALAQPRLAKVSRRVKGDAERVAGRVGPRPDDQPKVAIGPKSKKFRKVTRRDRLDKAKRDGFMQAPVASTIAAWETASYQSTRRASGHVSVTKGVDKRFVRR